MSVSYNPLEGDGSSATGGVGGVGHDSAFN